MVRPTLSSEFGHALGQTSEAAVAGLLVAGGHVHQRLDEAVRGQPLGDLRCLEPLGEAVLDGAETGRRRGAEALEERQFREQE